MTQRGCERLRKKEQAHEMIATSSNEYVVL